MFNKILQRLQLAVANRVESLALAFPATGPLYYALLSPKFQREQRAVLAGKARFSADHHSNGHLPVTVSTLRRNVHRLEKGLIMQPLRSVFATSYIEETVDLYSRARSARTAMSSELQWASAVLAEYFAIAGDEPAINRARSQFYSIGEPQSTPSPRPLSPYMRNIDEPLNIRYHDLLELAYRRRSVRWFAQKPVPRELIDKAVEVASESPSACNRQPFVFRIFDEPDMVKRVACLPMGTSGFYDNIPVVVVVVGQMRNFSHERDRHLIYIDGALAAMSFALALEVLGLSSCMINWPDVERLEMQMAKLIGLDDDERPVMLIALGYPDPKGLVPASAKKPIALLRQYG